MSTTFEKKVYGDDVTEITNKTTFDLDEKRELTLNIVDTDGDTLIPFSDIDSIKAIYIFSSSTFTIKLNDGVNDFLLSGTSFSLEPDTTFISGLSSINISTAETTAISVKIIILGESS